MWINGWIMMFAGLMLLTGEYLCVEAAWRCIDYNNWYVTFGLLLLGTGLLASLLGVTDD